MSIESIPAELQFAIGEFLDPFSSFDFALTNKHNWSLYNSIISKHKRLFAENRTINTLECEYPYKNHILWDKLREILDDEVVGEYVQEISLPSGRSTYLDGHVSHDSQLSAHSKRPSREDLDRYSIAKQKLESVYEWELTTPDDTFFGLPWDEWVSKGSSEPIIVMLIHYMPHLKTFGFSDLEMEHVFMPVLHIIAKSYANPSLAPRLPFQHLTTVAVAHWDTEFSCRSRWYYLFCAIPSVRTFIANAMSCENGDELHEGLPKSNVSELVFHFSVFNESAFESMLRHAPKLEKFSYEPGDGSVCYDMVYPARDLQALVEHAGDSLQHLVYELGELDDYYNEDDPSSNSLRGFKQLKTLRIDWRLVQPLKQESAFDDEEKLEGGFYEEDDESAGIDEEFDLRSILPASLEKLYLIGPMSSEEREVLEKMQNSRSEFTPLLKNIYIGGRDGCSQMGTIESEDVPVGHDVPGIHQNHLMRRFSGLWPF